jgi:hypothetical protein
MLISERHMPNESAMELVAEIRKCGVHHEDLRGDNILIAMVPASDGCGHMRCTANIIDFDFCEYAESKGWFVQDDLRAAAYVQGESQQLDVAFFAAIQPETERKIDAAVELMHQYKYGKISTTS